MLVVECNNFRARYLDVLFLFFENRLTSVVGTLPTKLGRSVTNLLWNQETGQRDN